MHTFGHPVELDGPVALLRGTYPLKMRQKVLDRLKGKYTGSFGKFGAVSFNGNKIITTGGGGMIYAPI